MQSIPDWTRWLTDDLRVPKMDIKYRYPEHCYIRSTVAIMILKCGILVNIIWIAFLVWSVISPLMSILSYTRRLETPGDVTICGSSTEYPSVLLPDMTRDREYRCFSNKLHPTVATFG